MTIRNQFPVLQSNPDLVYLDTAATALTPQSVIDAESSYYEEDGANAYRGLYAASERVTERVEQVRKQVSDFINGSSGDVIFTKSATEASNILARGISHSLLSEGDEIVVSVTDHHAQYLPWKHISLEKSLRFSEIPVDLYLEGVITPHTKVVAFPLVSNVLGCTIDSIGIIQKIRHIAPHAFIIIDAAQGITKQRVNVEELGCDALFFSGHKLYGPTGVGVLWMKKDLAASIPPLLMGGHMIEQIEEREVVLRESPAKFEGGTLPLAQIYALGEAIKFVQSHVLTEESRAYMKDLTSYLFDQVDLLGGRVHILSPREGNEGILSFTVDGIHPHDIAQICGDQHVAIRVGHHCAQPLHHALGIESSARISLGIYSTKADVDCAITSLEKCLFLFS